MTRRLLVPSIALLAVLLCASLAAAAPERGATDPVARAAPKKDKRPHCKKGLVPKRKHGKWTCVKRPAKPTPHPGLDVLGTPGTYKGSNGVTLTSSKSPEGASQIALRIVFPSGYVSCDGKPPYPTVSVSVGEMLVTDQGEFGGSSSKGGVYVQVHGHFTGPNTLTLETSSASNVRVGGQRCAAQYTNASVVF